MKSENKVGIRERLKVATSVEEIGQLMNEAHSMKNIGAKTLRRCLTIAKVKTAQFTSP